MDGCDSDDSLMWLGWLTDVTRMKCEDLQHVSKDETFKTYIYTELRWEQSGDQANQGHSLY